MFHYIIAACVVVSYGGEQVNPCYIQQSDELYKSMARCEVGLEEKKAEYWRMVTDTDLSLVADGFCSRYEKNES